MKKILFIVTILLVLLGAIVAWQTFQFRGRQMVVTPARPRKLDAERITSRLAGALQFRTVSHEDRSRIDYNEFTSLETYLEETFPALHSRLQKEVIGNHSLLFTWKGLDTDLKPVLVMAHMDVVPAETGQWKHPPFSGAIADGYVWGRGALDDP